MDAAISSNETLVDALALRIRTYKKEHSNLSGAQIARKFSMTASSFNRIENGDVRVPTIDQVLKVLRGTGATGDILKYLDANYPQIAETYRSVYDSKNTEFVPQDLEAHLNDKDKFLIILLALTGEGTSRVEVLREFGRKGLSELEYLLDKGHLIEEDGVIGKNEKQLNTSVHTLSKLLSYSIDDCFESSNIESGENYIAFSSIGINKKKALKRIISVMKDAHQEISEILNDPDLKGNDRFFYGFAIDSLIKNGPEVLYSENIGGIQ